MKYHILYNPLAGNGRILKSLNKMQLPEGCERKLIELDSINNLDEYFADLPTNDKIVICGGDGTLNRFVNSFDREKTHNDILYFASGSGNDFLKDLNLKPDNTLININKYISNLPLLKIRDRSLKFLNGIGYGLDGYVCSEINRKRGMGKPKVSYIATAIKAFLFGYKPCRATLNIDGKEFKYEKVWLAPTMKGRFFGGGMMIAPTQDRMCEDSAVTVVIAHNMSTLRILTLFPTIFKGKHIEYKRYLDIHKGNNISIKFERPSALQIDGETINDVDEYTVTANRKNLLV